LFFNSQFQNETVCCVYSSKAIYLRFVGVPYELFTQAVQAFTGAGDGFIPEWIVAGLCSFQQNEGNCSIEDDKERFPLHLLQLPQILLIQRGGVFVIPSDCQRALSVIPELGWDPWMGLYCYKTVTTAVGCGAEEEGGVWPCVTSLLV